MYIRELEEETSVLRLCTFSSIFEGKKYFELLRHVLGNCMGVTRETFGLMSPGPCPSQLGI